MVQVSKSKYKPPLFITFFLIFLITVGSSLRFAYLDRPPLNGDEKTSQLRVVGFTWGGASLFFKEDQIYTPLQIQQFYTVSKESKPQNVINSLAKDDSQHPPFFYLLSFIAAKLGDGSFITGRVISALSGTLAILAIYFLAKELFFNQTVGLLASAITSFSVYFLHLSQNFRQFSLWVALLALSSYLFIKFWRHHDIKSWTIYTAVNVISLYTFPLTALAMIGHSIHLALSKGGRTKLPLHLFSLGISFIFFVPWLNIMFQGRNKITATTQWLEDNAYTWQDWIIRFGRNLSDYFFRIGKYPDKYLMFSIGTFLLVLIAFTTWRKYRSFTVVLMPAVITLLPFIAQDIVLGGIRGVQARYFLPLFICTVIAIAYSINLIFEKNKWLGSSLFTIFLCFQIASIYNYFNASTWYAWGGANDNIKISKIIKAEDTILTSKRLTTLTYELSYLLPTENKFRIGGGFGLRYNPNKTNSIEASFITTGTGINSRVRYNYSF